MNIVSDFVDAVGRTPLIRLRRVSDETGCKILGKAEFMNPGGSVKDRAARGIVLDAELLEAGRCFKAIGIEIAEDFQTTCLVAERIDMGAAMFHHGQHP